MAGRAHFLFVFALSLGLGGLTCCDRLTEPEGLPAEPQPRKAGPSEEAAKLKSVSDPDDEDIYAFSAEQREIFTQSRFDALEATAAKLRASKEVFGNGLWKITVFYEAFDCSDEEPEGVWKQHEKIHKKWMEAKPDSAVARVAYAGFLANYAWYARGSGYADSVTPEGWRLFHERLDEAREILIAAHALPDKDKDPMFYQTAMVVALGKGWQRGGYDDLMTEALAFEPKFWSYDSARAYALLPRWYGRKGDWEDYAAGRPREANGLGSNLCPDRVRSAEVLREHFQVNASWPPDAGGLQALLKKYPHSLNFLSKPTILAKQAGDRTTAKDAFEKLGDSYLDSAWKNRAEFVRDRHWAQDGAEEVNAGWEKLGREICNHGLLAWGRGLSCSAEACLPALVFPCSSPFSLCLGGFTSCDKIKVGRRLGGKAQPSSERRNSQAQDGQDPYLEISLLAARSE